MALSATRRFHTVMGDKRVVGAEFTFDSSYPTGGEDVAPGLVGLSTIEAVFPVVNGTEFAVYDYASQNLMLYTADGTQAANASDQSAVKVNAFVVGY